MSDKQTLKNTVLLKYTVKKKKPYPEKTTTTTTKTAF